MDSSEDLNRRVREAWEAERWPEALALLRQLEAAYPDSLDIAYSKAVCLLRLGNPAEARPLLVRILQQKPADPEALALLQEAVKGSPVPAAIPVAKARPSPREQAAVPGAGAPPETKSVALPAPMSGRRAAVLDRRWILPAAWGGAGLLVLTAALFLWPKFTSRVKPQGDSRVQPAETGIQTGINPDTYLLTHVGLGKRSPNESITWPEAVDSRHAAALQSSTSAGLRVLKTDGWRVVITERVTGKEVFAVKPFPEGVERIQTATFSPCGRYVLAGGNSGSVVVWDIAAREPRWRFPGRGEDSSRIVKLGFSPSMDRIIAIDSSGVLRVWSKDAPALVEAELAPPALAGKSFQLNFTLAGSLHAFSPDEKVLAWLEPGCRGPRLLDVASGSQLATLGTHEGDIGCLAFSSDGKQLVTGGSEGVVKLWDVASGKEVRSFFGHRSGVGFVRMLLRDQRIISAGSDSQLRLWDAATGRCLLTAPTARFARNPCYSVSRDQTRLLVGDTQFGLYNVESGARVQLFNVGRGPFRPPELDGLLLSPDSALAASWGKGTPPIVWSCVSGAKIFDLGTPLGWNWGAAVFFTTNNAQLIWQDESRVRILDIAKGKETDGLLKFFNLGRGKVLYPMYEHVMPMPEAQALYWAASVDSEPSRTGLNLYRWTGLRHEKVLALPLRGDRVQSLTLSPDLRRISALLLPEEARPSVERRIWEVPSGDEIQSFWAPREVMKELDFLRDPARALTRGERGLGIWGPKPDALAWSTPDEPPGEQLLGYTQDYWLQAWRTRRDLRFHHLAGGPDVVITNVPGPRSAAFSRDGRRAALSAGGQNQSVLVALPAGAKLHSLIDSDECAAFSPDGLLLARGGGGGLALLDATTGRAILRNGMPHRNVSGLTFFAGGRRILSVGRESMKIWQATSGQELKEMHGPKADLLFAAPSADGTLLVSAHADGTVRLWNPQTGQETATLAGHTRPALAVAFSPDNRRVVSGGEDHSIIVWEAATGRMLARCFVFPEAVKAARFMPGGKNVAALSSTGQVRCWQTEGWLRFSPIGQGTEAGPAVSVESWKSQAPVADSGTAEARVVAWLEKARSALAAINEGEAKSWMRRDLILATARCGNPAEAKALVKAFPGRAGISPSWLYTSVAVIQGEAGDFSGARETIGAIADLHARAMGYLELVELQIKAGDLDSTRQTLALAKSTADTISQAQATGSARRMDLRDNGSKNSKRSSALGLAYAQMGDFATAKALADRSSQDDAAAAYAAILRAQAAAGDLTGARATASGMSAVGRLDPDVEVLAALVARGEDENAKRLAEGLKAGQARQGFAVGRARRGDLDGVVAALRTSGEPFVSDDLLSEVAAVKLKARDYPAARKAAARMNQHPPARARTLLAIARAQIAAHDLTGAQATLALVGEVNSDEAVASAELLARLGDVAAAKAYAAKFQQIIAQASGWEKTASQLSQGRTWAGIAKGQTEAGELQVVEQWVAEANDPVRIFYGCLGIAEGLREQAGTPDRASATAAARSPSPQPSAALRTLTIGPGKGFNLELVEVPAGDFMRQGVNIHFRKPFYIGRLEVTQEQWTAVMGRNPSEFQGDGRLPVERVSWEECLAFCTNVSRVAGRRVRLPSEAEWEYACRAGDKSDQFREAPVDEQKNRPEQIEIEKARAARRTYRAGLDRPNAWGLHDMIGNVYEWCQDAWHETYFDAPNDGSAWTNAVFYNEINFRVCRGGDYSERHDANRYVGRELLGLRVAADAD